MVKLNMKPLPKSSSALLYQYGNEKLRRENEILRKQLNLLKKKQSIPNDMAIALTELVAMQRKHIESLEEEFENTQIAYENALKGHMSLYQLQTELEEAKGKYKLLQETIDELNEKMGKEISSMKTKFVEQNARLILGKDTNFQSKTSFANHPNKPILSPIKRTSIEYMRYDFK